MADLANGSTVSGFPILHEGNLDKIVIFDDSPEGIIRRMDLDVNATPDTVPLRNSGGTFEVGPPTSGNHPLRKIDTEVNATPDTVPLRNSGGTFEVGPPTSGDHPLRLSDQHPPTPPPPAGIIMAYAGSEEPNGYLECDGRSLNRYSHYGLYNAIGTRYGRGNGSSTFNIPDLRGEFIRGLDNFRTLGSTQSSAAPNITGRVYGAIEEAGSYGSGAFTIISHGSPGTAPNGNTTWGFGFDASRSSSVYQNVNEIRPRNIALMYIIKT